MFLLFCVFQTSLYQYMYIHIFISLCAWIYDSVVPQRKRYDTSKKTPTYPCFAYPRNPFFPQIKGIPKHKPLVGGLPGYVPGYVPGVCWKILRDTRQLLNFCMAQLRAFLGLPKVLPVMVLVMPEDQNRGGKTGREKECKALHFGWIWNVTN